MPSYAARPTGTKLWPGAMGWAAPQQNGSKLTTRQPDATPVAGVDQALALLRQQHIAIRSRNVRRGRARYHSDVSARTGSPHRHEETHYGAFALGAAEIVAH
eukprot:scaffold4810_cov112-Isochrysis_galbana.AAC.4